MEVDYSLPNFVTGGLSYDDCNERHNVLLSFTALTSPIKVAVIKVIS